MKFNNMFIIEIVAGVAGLCHLWRAEQTGSLFCLRAPH